MKQKILAGAGKEELVFPENYFPWERYGGIHDAVSVRAMVFEGDVRVCIVSAELPSLKPYSLIDGFRQQVAVQTGIPAENVWICVTHNVSAPHVPPESDPVKHAGHVAMVERAIHAAVEQALADLRPAKFGTGNAEAYVNVNRDILSADGWAHGISGTGPSDKTLTVVRIDDLDDRPIAALFNYAVKTAVMDEALQRDGYRYVTADLTGRACGIAEETVRAPVLYFMGAAGDQVPRKKTQYNILDEHGQLREVNHYEKGFQWVEELGSELGSSVVSAWRSICPREDGPVEVTRTAFSFKGQKGFPAGQPKGPTKTYQYIEDGEKIVETEILRIQDAVLLGIKPETTSIVGSLLKQKSPFLHTMVAAMVNGGLNYMADETEYDRCIFEGTHSVLWRGSAELYVDRITNVLKELKEK